MLCRQYDLNRLINCDEDSQEFRLAAEHIERCKKCQAKLGQVSVQGIEWWNEAKSSWVGEDLPTPIELERTRSVVIEIESSMSPDDRIDIDKVSLDFLDRAVHPELLGRLGRYDIERVVGQGGMGVVLKGFDTELHRVVAIKVLAPHLAHHSSARRRFAREAQAAAAVVHPHVIPIFDVESNGKLPYIVMQYVPGQSLQARVDSLGPLPVTDTLRIAQQTAAGLAAAHAQGLVHRDVKPANILMEETVDRVLLSDFGLARTVDDASLTRTGVVAGTPFYMSPEQAHGDAIDSRSDLFSLGSVIYFMLTGRPPFRASGAMAVLNRICTESPRPLEQINSDVPYEVARVVEKLLAKSPDKRFASAIEVEQVLGKLLAAMQSGGLSIEKRPRQPMSRIASLPKLSRESYAVATISIAMVAVLSILYAFWPISKRFDESEPVSNDRSISVNQFRLLKEQDLKIRQEDQLWIQRYNQLALQANEYEQRPSSSLAAEDSFWPSVLAIEKQIHQMSESP